MNKGIGFAVVIMILLAVGYFIYSNSNIGTPSIPEQQITLEQGSKSPTSSQKVDRKASFAIFTNGTFRVFTASMYHNLSQDVYIEASNPNIVQVKMSGTTWRDFFSTLPFTLTTECLTTGTNETFCTGKGGTLQFYLNGEKEDNVFNQEINEGDKLLVTFGTETDQAIQQQLNKIPKL